MKSKTRQRARFSQSGSSLFIVASAMLALIGLCGLAIDLVSFYTGKSEAQRAADAGALAGATVFASTGCTSSGAGAGTDCLNGTITTIATQQATTVATDANNKVGGQAATIPPPVFTRGDGNTPTHDPLITVTANATMPTFFMKIFGIASVNISATATAEAYNPAGSTSGPPLCTSCLKPFLLPNCDPNHLAPATANPSCAAGGNENYFVKPDKTVANPGPYPAGVIGETWQLHTNQVSSHWYEIAFDCSQSANAFVDALQQCDTNVFNCGSTLCALDGNKVGPNNHGVCRLITYDPNCNKQNSTSIDSLTVNAGSTPPYTITAGSGNPFFPAGSTITQSASVVSVPLFDGHDIGSGNATVTVVGYMKVFIQSIAHSGKDDIIQAVILDVTSCGSGGGGCGTSGGGSGSGGTVSGGGASFVPVRLVHRTGDTQ